MKRSLERFGVNQSGAVAPLVAVSLFALIAVAGIAFDYARMAGMDTELQNAADHATLAAASQLDGLDGACSRARAAALGLVENNTLFANDGRAIAVTVTDANDSTTVADDPDTEENEEKDAQCNSAGGVRFYKDKGATQQATNDADAQFVEVTVNSRRANYALTVVVSALTSGDINATARAGLGSAICKIPPLMICNPFSTNINWNEKAGFGLKAVSEGWTPGGFGYLGPQSANATQELLAFLNPTFTCQSTEDGMEVSTGQPTPAITAINTRFDIYDYGSGSGETLAPCSSGECPAASNVAKDLVRPTPSGNNACKYHNNGWKLPTNRFQPGNTPDATTGNLDPNGSDAMGLPRDNCHYESYGSACPEAVYEQRLGDGNWARADYFNKYHPVIKPTSWNTNISRYNTYLWELGGHMPDQSAVSGHSAPVCSTGTSSPARRVLELAVADNCEDLSGSSTNAQIGDWIEVFLVEPGVKPPGRGNGDSGNEIYLEIIREIDPAGETIVQRREVPYLVR